MSGDNFSILHVSQPTNYGVANCVAAFVRDQVRRGWRVTVACPSDGWLAGEVQKAGASYLALTVGRELGASVLAEIHQLDKLVSSVDPSAVHLHSSKAGLAGRLAIRGRRPTLFQPHAWSFLAVDPKLKRAAVRWERWALRWSNVVICCSESEAEEGRVAGISGPTVVVPNAVDAARLAEITAEDRDDARRQIGVGDEEVVVCIGRLVAQKGQDMLLGAWPAVRSSFPTARLVLLGDGPDRSMLGSLATAGVEFAGWQPNVATWLAAADVAVVPSRYEGLSLSLLEAMAAGCCVVAFDVAGVGEVIRRAASPVGRAVALGDLDAMADAIIERLSDTGLRQAEGAAARAYVLKEHSPDRWLDRIAEVTLSCSARTTGWPPT